MVVGAFGPWAKVIGLVNVSVSGTDGGRDGWGVVAAAVVGALALVAWDRKNRLFAIGTLLAGGASTVLCYSDRQDVAKIADENTSTLGAFEVGWGLNLALAGSFVFGIVGLVALLGNPNAPDMPKRPATAPSGEDPKRTHRECPHCKEQMRRDASVCPLCQRDSLAWTQNDGFWWRPAEDGSWLYLDEVSGEWRVPASPA